MESESNSEKPVRTKTGTTISISEPAGNKENRINDRGDGGRSNETVRRTYRNRSETGAFGSVLRKRCALDDENLTRFIE